MHIMVVTIITICMLILCACHPIVAVRHFFIRVPKPFLGVAPCRSQRQHRWHLVEVRPCCGPKWPPSRNLAEWPSPRWSRSSRERTHGGQTLLSSPEKDPPTPTENKVTTQWIFSLSTFYTHFIWHHIFFSAIDQQNSAPVLDEPIGYHGSCTHMIKWANGGFWLIGQCN